MLTQQQALMHVRAAYPSQTILPLPADSVICADDMYTFTIVKLAPESNTTCFVSPVSGIITEEDDEVGMASEFSGGIEDAETKKEDTLQ